MKNHAAYNLALIASVLMIGGQTTKADDLADIVAARKLYSQNDSYRAGMLELLKPWGVKHCDFRDGPGHAKLRNIAKLAWPSPFTEGKHEASSIIKSVGSKRAVLCGKVFDLVVETGF